MAGRIPKVATGKEVGGWWEAGRSCVPGLFRPSTVEVRDRSGGPLRALPGHGLFKPI